MAKDTQIRFVSPKAWERIEQWSRRKPVFALMGEFSAGKSTLMNFLLRKQALPTQVTATQLPPVWFSWGNKPAYVMGHDGATRTIDLDQLDQVGVNDAQFIRIYLQADILEAVDLIDTPGISDPKIQSDVWRRAVGQANGVLWCTHSTQAWRETERATWVSLPERLHHNSLLLVTRADALDLKDRQKVLRRVNREAGHLFNRTILFSARDAIIARDKTGDAELWSRSGGGKMIDSFLEITEHIMDNRAEMLTRYQIDKSLSDAPRVAPSRPAGKTSSAEPAQVAPLQLTDPVPQDEAFEAVRNSDDVIATFPVRPTRVERRSTDGEKPRIDVEDAERMRAEMTSEVEPVDDLRALFRDNDEDRLNIAELPGSTTGLADFADEDEFALGEDEELVAADEQAGADDARMLKNLSEDLTDDLADSLNADNTGPAQTPAPQDMSDIETSVSSIAALLSEQESNGPDSYEPEPESNALTDDRVVVVSDEAAQPGTDASLAEPGATLEHMLPIQPDQSLSAAAMWRKVTDSEELPEDPEALRVVFQAFLEEFDQITQEFRSNSASDATMARTEPLDGAERHVL